MADAAVETEKAIDEVTAEVSNEVTKALQGAIRGDFSEFGVIFEVYLMPIGIAVLFLIVGYFVASFLSRIVSNPLKKRVDETIGRFVSKFVFYSIMTFVVLGILGRFGISVASFAAVIAAAGFAVGLAFQGTLSNFAAGILLLVFRPFKVGDFVNAASIKGTIDEIDLFTTTFDTLDNRRIIVPNSNIANDIIENVTYHSERRVDISVGVDYSADTKDTRAALEEAAEKLDSQLIKGEKRGYQIFLKDLGDSSVNWEVRFWARSAEYWDVWQKLTEEIKYALERADIGIPFPQMDIHVVDLPKGEQTMRLKASGE